MSRAESEQPAGCKLQTPPCLDEGHVVGGHKWQ